MRPSRPGHIAVACMVAALVAGRATARDIVDESGLSIHCVRDHLRAMHKRRAIHVAAWEQDAAGRQLLAAYSLGSKPDAPRVPPRTRAERMRHYRARKAYAKLLLVAA